MTTVPEFEQKCDPKVINFSDNLLLPALFGKNDSNLLQVEQALAVSIVSRGNSVLIAGSTDLQEIAHRVLESLYTRLVDGLDVGPGEVDGTIRMIQAESSTTTARGSKTISIQTRKRTIAPRSPNQRKYIEALENNELVFALGPAGTGKTYLAVAVAVSHLLRGEVSRIILSRPAVEAGERLGFLPGDIKDKVDPYLRPLYDALYDMLPADKVFRKLEIGEIEVAPLAFMRGRTLANAYVIVDEAQNTTPMQMKMLLTRLGDNARMVVTGDLSQADLAPGQTSGLREAARILRGIKGIAFMEFSGQDVVRNSLVATMVSAYENDERKQKTRKDSFLEDE